jgi:hypothetical protein
MSFQYQPSLQGTLKQLKEIVTGLQGEDHESTRLLGQMEELVTQIETKHKYNGKEPSKASTLAMKAATGAAPAAV